MPRPPGVDVKSTRSALRDVVLPLPLSSPHEPAPVAPPCDTGVSTSTGDALATSPPAAPGVTWPVGALLKFTSYAVHENVCPWTRPVRATDARPVAASGFAAKAPPVSITVE